MEHILSYDWLRYILFIGLGRTMKAAEEKDQINQLFIDDSVCICRAAPGFSRVCYKNISTLAI